VNRERLSLKPTEQSLDAIAEVAEFLRPDQEDLCSWHDSYVSHHSQRIALDLDIVKTYVTSSNASVLAFGSLPLLFTAGMANSGLEVTGCDIAPERYASAIEKANLDVVKCNIEHETLPFADNAFDGIVFNELFEHLRINPIFTLSEVLRVIKPGAPVMISTPNLRSVEGIRNFLFHNRAYSCSADVYDEYAKLEKLGHMGHVREYTTKEVTSFLTKVGFKVTHMLFRGDVDSSWGNWLINYKKSLSPFVSYVAIKPN